MQVRSSQVSYGGIRRSSSYSFGLDHADTKPVTLKSFRSPPDENTKVTRVTDKVPRVADGVSRVTDKFSWIADKVHRVKDGFPRVTDGFPG